MDGTHGMPPKAAILEENGGAGAAGDKRAEEFRDYRAEARPSVKELYRLNHENQTVEFVFAKERQYLGLNHCRMGMWEVLEKLEALVDDSDPDTENSQIAHALQSAEAARRDGQPPWFVLTALIHDAGKILALWGEPQWAVVGDTFPVGCAHADRIVFPELFAGNPDRQIAAYCTPSGIYDPGCGLDSVHMSWGHDEYLYHVVKEYLPMEALYMIRYHSFYAAHREGAYGHLMNEQDRRMMEWVRRFNPYDLYTKAHAPPDVKELAPYYRALIARYLPDELYW
jgi:inositol oxygenase